MNGLHDVTPGNDQTNGGVFLGGLASKHIQELLEKILFTNYDRVA
jgi:hypothetical protein